MTLDEGYIKYEMDWTPGPAVHVDTARQLDRWRQPLHAAGLIGEYAEEGIGFGNLSLRHGAPGQFLISGTQTGSLVRTNAQHYALVTHVDIERNTVRCEGPVPASSEAMTHAAIYALDDAIGAVVHVHSLPLWQRLRGELPTTDPDVAYGTPEMAREFRRLYDNTEFNRDGIAIMAGHDEGLISFGPSLRSAAQRLLRLAHP